MKKILVTQSSMPSFEEYIEMIQPLWDSHWLTNMGILHQQFEQKLQEFLHVPYVSLFVNGHMALEMAIQAFGFEEGSEVITTPFTFVSTTHAIVRNKLNPVFCDVKESDGTIDENMIESLITDKTVAIVPVHVYGNVCNVEKIDEIANKYGLKVIYDAAHAFGVSYNNKGIGTFGDASIFSFHATKVFNTIEGGAVVFKEKELYDKLYNLKNFGIQNEELVTAIGANAKMNEFSAAMGLCNLRHIDKAIENRKQRWMAYAEKIKGISGVRMIVPNENVVSNYAYLPIVVEKNYKFSRDELHERLLENQIVSRKYFYPLTCDQMCYKELNKDADVNRARLLSEQILCLPMYEGLEFESIECICNLISG